jgi:signal transduction histidine kinase
MQLQAVAEDFPNEHSLADVEYILGQSIEKARTLSNEISPPVLHHTGLIGALEWLVQRMGEQFDLVVELNTDVERQHEYTPLKTFLFRTVQELLFNVVKHSGVKRARIEVCGSDSQVSVSVCDGGRGFLPDIIGQSKAGFGLMSIRERAGYIGGSLTIDSAPGRGSRFTLTVPLGPLTNRDSKRHLPGR